MKSIIILILLTIFSFNSWSQTIKLNRHHLSIIHDYINDEECYKSQRSFYGCIAAVKQLGKLQNQEVYLVQKKDGFFGLVKKTKNNDNKYYQINLHSKYFVKSLAQDFYSQSSRFSFSHLLKELTRNFKPEWLLNVLNAHYAYKYDFHSYLSPDSDDNSYSLPLVLKKIKNTTFVQFIFPYSVASHQNIQKGDKVIAINGIDTAKLSEAEIKSQWKQASSSFVILDIDRSGTSWKVYFSTTQNKIHTEYIDSNTTYFRLSTIDESTYSIIKGSLRQRSVDQVILDLRSVDGGYVHSALKTAALFMHESPWVKLYDIENSEKSIIEMPAEAVKDYKLIILVDEETKSAAEMLAGLVATVDYSLILGRNTYGKGSVQKSTSWKYSQSISEWKTLAFYRLPEWGKVQKYGIEVDINMGFEIAGSLREQDFYLSLTDTGVEVNDYLKYPLRRSLMRVGIDDCIFDYLKASKWPKFKSKDKVLEAAINGLHCLD